MLENDISEMSIDDVKSELEAREIKVHHKAGEAKLRKTLQAVVDGTYQAATESDDSEEVSEPKVEAKATKPKKLTKEQEALRLVRIIVSPNDPVKAGLPGHIFTLCSSKINNGKAIKKYVPFNNEEGWHVPHAIYEQIKSAQMQKFKPVRMANGETAMQPYLTRMYNVEVLPALTESELKALAAQQKGRGDT